MVYLHPNIKELSAGRYNKKGQQLLSIFKENNVNFILGVNKKNNLEYYRDKIHLNAKGHAYLAEYIQPYVEKHLKEN